jgi:uncharacterized protein (TIRG00374 family)
LSALRLGAGVILSVVLLGVLVWRIDLHVVGRQLASTHWGWALASAFFAIAGIWTRARRWQYLFPPGSNPPALFRATMIGYMANNVLPLRAGELVRVYVMARYWSHGFWMPLATLVVERVLDGLAVVLLLGGLLFAVPVPPAFRWTAGVFLALDLVAVAVLVAIALSPRACQGLIRRLAGRWPRLEGRLVRVFEIFVRGLSGIQTPHHAGPIVVWSLLVWLTAALAAWTALFAARLDVPPIAAFVVLGFVALGVSLPSAPGYIGVFHTAAVIALAIFGVSQPVAFGYAIVFHACGFIPITLFGWVLLLREHLSLGAVTQQRARTLLES